MFLLNGCEQLLKFIERRIDDRDGNKSGSHYTSAPTKSGFHDKSASLKTAT